MESNYGTLTSLVKVVGALTSATVAVGLAWRGRTQWEPAEQDISKGPQKVSGLMTTVVISLLWALKSESGDIPYLTRTAVLCTCFCFAALIIYGLLISIFIYEGRSKNNAGVCVPMKIIGGFQLLPAARSRLQDSKKTIQEHFAEVDYLPDRVWGRVSRSFSKATFVVAYIILTFSGTVGLSAAGIIVLLSKTDFPIPVDKSTVHIGVVLNGNVHYTTEIMSGFEIGLDQMLKKTRYTAHIEQSVGLAAIPQTAQNAGVFSNLIARFKKPPDYLVTIGTGVSEFARGRYFNQIPLVFIGVTDPVRSGLVPSLAPSADRGNIAGTTYGVSATVYWNLLTNAFPHHVFGFILSEEYDQDLILCDELVALARRSGVSDRLVSIKVAAPPLTKEQQEMADVFFGRYLVSTQIEKFVNGSRKPFVGASIMNVYQGAVLAIGSDDRHLGRLAVEKIIIPSLMEGRALCALPIVQTTSPIIGVNLKAARDLGVSIPKAVLDQATYRVNP